MAKLLPELRGNKFVGQVLDITNPLDGAFGQDPTPRKCIFCLFRENAHGDCDIADGSAKLAFGIQLEEMMPRQIDGQEVGFYCRFWCHFCAE